jgi:DnaK suppressor protein
MQALTAAQRAELIEDLHGLERSLGEALELARPGARPVALDTAIGRVSRIDAIQQQQLGAAGRAALEVRLSQVRRALALGDEYGDCAHCGEPVGFRRLKIRPEASLCVTCQGARER